MSEPIPVTYELDEHGEANGRVHYFCSKNCRSCRESGSGFGVIEMPPHAFGTAADAEVLTDTRCEFCGRDVRYYHEPKKMTVEQAQQMSTTREGWAKLKAMIVDVMVDEWLNDGPEEVKRVLTLWATREQVHLYPSLDMGRLSEVIEYGQARGVIEEEEPASG